MQLPNTFYETIGGIIGHLKKHLLTFDLTLSDDMKVEAVEYLETLDEDDVNHIFLTIDLDWLMICLYGSVIPEDDAAVVPDEDDF